MSKATYNNQTVSIVSVNGGWSTIELKDGTTKKVRNGTLTAVVEKAKKEFSAECTYCGHVHLVTGTATITCHKCGEDFEPEAIDTRLRRIKKAKYDPNNYRKIKSVNGHSSFDCGDKLAKQFHGAELDDVYEEAATVLELTVKELKDRYKHLNAGMQRMNLGNRIRSAINKAANEA